MGVIGWFIYGIIFIIAKITKYHTKENQAKRIVKSAKRQLKKSKKNWLKWYKKYGKYSSNAWNIVRTQYTEVVEKMRETGFNYNNSENQQKGLTNNPKYSIIIVEKERGLIV